MAPAKSAGKGGVTPTPDFGAQTLAEAVVVAVDLRLGSEASRGLLRTRQSATTQLRPDGPPSPSKKGSELRMRRTHEVVIARPWEVPSMLTCVKRTAALALLGVVAGCRTEQPAATAERLPVEIIVGPDGKPAGIIDCAGGMHECYRVAGRVCPSGYSIVDRESRVVGTRTKSSGTGTRVGNTTVGGGTATTRVDAATSLIVSCPGITERKNELDAANVERARAVNAEARKPKRCGYTCAPQPRVCPWLDDNGCYKPGYDPPEE